MSLQRDVAERVMGWRWYFGFDAIDGELTDDAYTMLASPQYLEKWSRQFGESVEPTDAHRSAHVLLEPCAPDWHSDPGAAWQVVERMQELGYEAAVFTSDGRWQAGFCSQSNEAMRHAPTMPEAVCRAALAAVEASE